MTREELKRRLKPFVRQWHPDYGTVHGDLDEVIDAILAQDTWDKIAKRVLPISEQEEAE